MFGLSLSSLVAIVKPIIEVLGAAASLFQKGRGIWKDLRQKNSTDEWQSLVSTSERRIRQEYNKGFRMFGRAFAEGDDISRQVLGLHYLTLQDTVIPLLSLDPSFHTARFVLHSYDQAADYFATAMNGSMTAMQEFGQRLMQKAPIKRAPAPPRPDALWIGRNRLPVTRQAQSSYAFQNPATVTLTSGNATAIRHRDALHKRPVVSNVPRNKTLRDYLEGAQTESRTSGPPEVEIIRHRLTPEQRNAGFNCFEESDWEPTQWNDQMGAFLTCPTCEFEVMVPHTDDAVFDSAAMVSTKDARLLDLRCYFAKFHFGEGTSNGFPYRAGLRCFLCKTETVYKLSRLTSCDQDLRSILDDPDGFKAHVEDCHTWAEVCGGNCSFVFCGSTR
ncbi:hypothetical protein B0A48_13470 [Cryoendolithus antarcticus]|uniref:Uncharacterized protein n=1 Tax=Cryoendolithus antarcticus TaxID=1507870 RepID=A0A1V8SNR7_9PEZI|nr:hypothetical protein B0A48_13470 [Cryoendolithus antarcticus]